LWRCSATLFLFLGGDLTAKGHNIIYNAIPVKVFFLSKSITICSSEANAALWLIREFFENGAPAESKMVVSWQTKARGMAWFLFYS
jgi:hypothetical protein